MRLVENGLPRKGGEIADADLPLPRAPECDADADQRAAERYQGARDVTTVTQEAHAEIAP